MCRRHRKATDVPRNGGRLRHLHDHGHVLPTAAQRLLPGYYARPDFAYGAEVVIFIDGPVHEYPNIAERDVSVRKALEAGGYLVIGLTESITGRSEHLQMRRPGVYQKTGAIE